MALLGAGGGVPQALAALASPGPAAGRAPSRHPGASVLIARLVARLVAEPAAAGSARHGAAARDRAGAAYMRKAMAEAFEAAGFKLSTSPKARRPPPANEEASDAGG